MIKKRISKVQQNTEETKPETEKVNSSYEVDFKTYEEQAIAVLNILEKQGVDIYDDSRYGGMYLKNSKGKIASRIKETFKEEKKKEIQNPNLNNLFNHFKNNK
jgi:hypothetical protein